MKKKLFAFLLAAVMVTALLPTMAFAGQQTPVTKIVVAIDYPEEGEEFGDDVSVISDPDYSIGKFTVKWLKVSADDYIAGYDALSWVTVEEGEVAEAEYVYMPKVTVYPNSDYTVENVSTVEFNEMETNKYTGAGQKEESYRINTNATGSSVDVWGYSLQFESSKYLTQYWVTIGEPQVGKTFDFAPKAEFLPLGSITIPDVTWFKCAKNDDNWVEVEEDEVAEEGYLYGARLVGYLGENYKVAETASVKVNGTEFTTDVTQRNSYSVYEGKLAINAYFEPTAADDETTTASGETTTAETDGTNPKTGDNGNMFMWIALMAAGAAAAGVAVANRRKFSGR